MGTSIKINPTTTNKTKLVSQQLAHIFFIIFKMLNLVSMETFTLQKQNVTFLKVTMSKIMPRRQILVHIEICLCTNLGNFEPRYILHLIYLYHWFL